MIENDLIYFYILDLENHQTLSGQNRPGLVIDFPCVSCNNNLQDPYWQLSKENARKEGIHMKVMERHVHAVYPGKWADLMKLEKKFDTVESRYGHPPKRSYQCMSGSHTLDTFVIEREWDSLAAAEAAWEKAMADPEWQTLASELSSYEASPTIELYMPLA